LDAVLVCCRKAASEGDSGALCWLGIAHEQGIGVEKDSALAARLYHKAAALGDSQARLLLRTMAAHDADAVELAASLDRYTHRPGASESSPREPRPAGDPRGESLRAPRTFGAFMARALGVLFGVVLIAGFVYVMVKLVKWAWFN
jgi:TPR repeat protein